MPFTWCHCMCPLAETIITRECLSSLRSVRTDIPADHYEGCRPAAKDVRLAHYVNNSIKELDIRRYAFIITHQLSMTVWSVQLKLSSLKYLFFQIQQNFKFVPLVSSFFI
jgi:hypothetical protein